MAKHLLEDMVKVKYDRREDSKLRDLMEKNVIENNNKKNNNRYMLWFTAFISLVFCFFAVSFLFSKAEIVVNPKIKELDLDLNFSINKEPAGDALSFDLVVINGEENKSVQASGEKEVKELATGFVNIFNAYSSSPQALNIDTRLEGSNGKIYKTKTKIVVPGMNKDGTPGKVEVGIYAAGVGKDYNSGPLDFTIVGFKGSAKYLKFTVRSKPGTTITGGFEGKVPVVSDAEKMVAILGIKNTLKEKLLKQAIDQTPLGFILFNGATFFDINDSNVISTAKDNNVIYKINGTLYGVLLNEQNLTKKIAESNIEKYDGGDIYIPNIEDLNFSLLNKENTLSENIKNLNFNLVGPLKIVWRLDMGNFVKSLLGKDKKDFNQTLLQYQNIESAVLTLNPVWKMSIPSQEKDIKVLVNYPK